jgi:hypothetical protein
VPLEPLDTEIPQGLTTLHLWAPKHGRTYNHVRQFWRRRPGFPSPVGTLEPADTHRRGRRELLFDEAALDAWLATQTDLEPPERINLAVLSVGLDERITLGRFAGLIGKNRRTVTQHRDRSGFPAPGDDGRYRAGDLLDYWNQRLGRRTRLCGCR